MIITRKWLNKYIDFSDIINDEIIEALNNLGFEVKRTHNFDCNSNIVFGKIKIINKIINSNLKFCLIDIGEKKFFQTICDANNIVKNGYVFVAKQGSILYNNIKIEKQKIKGYNSEVMICTLNKLGINKKYLTKSEQNEIILIINKKEICFNNKIDNKNILCNIGLTDYLFDIDLTINRSDCLSAYELARELANYFNRKLFPLELKLIENSKKYKNKLKVIISTLAVKSAISINIKLLTKKKELKLSDRIWLKINEYKSKKTNQFIDLSIKTALETGQPLLLYDFNKIKKKLKITDNYENKIFNIKKGDLVIVDDNEFVELIGIKVNNNYSIDSTTKEITVLSLQLDHILMRQQQKKFIINNINLQRYIKPSNYNKVILGISRYLYLLKINGLFKKISFLNFIKKYKKKIKPIEITLLEINKFIGNCFTLLEIKNLLKPLLFKFKEKGKKILITPPIIRNDIFQKADLFEEIARLFGYNNIISKPPMFPNLVKIKNYEKKTIKNFENFFLNNGFYQTKTYSLVKKQEIDDFNFFNYKKPYKLLSPLSEKHQVMRLSLTNSLLNVALYNNARNNKNIKIFTIEKIYENNIGNNYHGAFLMQLEIIKNKTINYKFLNSFFYIKNLLEAYLISEKIDINKLSYKNAPKNKVYHPYQTSSIFLDNKLLSIIGILNPNYQKKINLKNKIYFGEINFELIFNYLNKTKIFFKPISKFSSSNRDVSIWIPITINYEQIKKNILFDIKNIVKIEVIDKYFDIKLMPNHVALTISFTFNSIEKQLTESEINYQFNKIKINLKKLKLKIR